MDTTIVGALIGAAATIGAALIMISHSRDRESSQPRRDVSPRPDSSADRHRRLPGSESPVAQMPRFTVHGEVIRTVGKDLGIRVKNADELREFWQEHRIDTRLDWFGEGPPIASIGRKGDIERCKPGDRASLTFVVEERANGKRGIKTVGFEVHPSDASPGAVP